MGIPKGQLALSAPSQSPRIGLCVRVHARLLNEIELAVQSLVDSNSARTAHRAHILNVNWQDSGKSIRSLFQIIPSLLLYPSDFGGILGNDIIRVLLEPSLYLCNTRGVWTPLVAGGDVNATANLALRRSIGAPISVHLVRYTRHLALLSSVQKIGAPRIRF
jgi:hypothetical protein